MSITPDSTDAEIAHELREIEQRQQDIDKIERVARAPLKARFGFMAALCRECLRLRKDIAELRAERSEKR